VASIDGRASLRVQWDSSDGGRVVMFMLRSETGETYAFDFRSQSAANVELEPLIDDVIATVRLGASFTPANGQHPDLVKMLIPYLALGAGSVVALIVVRVSRRRKRPTLSPGYKYER
jgi:hypothetical protein